MRFVSTTIFVVILAGITGNGHLAAAQDGNANTTGNAPYVLFDLRDDVVWNLNHYQILDPDAETISTLITYADQGPLNFDLVLQSIVLPYCDVRFDPAICDGHGIPVDWLNDLPQTLCMEIPASVALEQASKLKDAKYLCLEPRENLVLPDNWEHYYDLQTYLSQRVETSAITVADGIAIIDIQVLDTINTPLSILSPDGYGPVEIGMTDDQIRAHMITPMTSSRDDNLQTEQSTCYDLQPASGPNGLGFMIRDGKLARISIYADEYDIATSLIRTDRGITVGNTIDDVRAAYGKELIDQENDYEGPDSRYLTWWTDKTETSGIRFETGPDGIVSAIHAGGRSITLIEGCA
ncbi:hypothetical protein [Thalassospira alkalitolerans]|uniref:hypothetical protein n=1 Tax=Thalassospira alkalitolerans TaxID=1293890 RepID=UPI003AA903A8